MKKKTENKHETPEQMMKRISIQVDDDIILDERKEAGKHISDSSPFKKLLATFTKDGQPILTSEEKKANKSGVIYG